ncbi:hypothetical protein D554_2041 [Bordetella holmesii 30539]|nr:hypothetical protein D554_2041 [Bordetella holmesii 30539]
MREHSPLGHPRSAARVLQHGQVVHAQFGRGETRARPLAEPATTARPPPDARTAPAF